MKQIIIMIAMLVLGISIGGMVMGFSEQAEAIKETGIKAVSSFTSEAAVD